jgi:hypothetical protein
VSSKREQIPIYAADGTSLGFRTIEAARRLIASGYVKPAYSRKGCLKAILLQQEDGDNPIETRAPSDRQYVPHHLMRCGQQIVVTSQFKNASRCAVDCSADGKRGAKMIGMEYASASFIIW